MAAPRAALCVFQDASADGGAEVVVEDLGDFRAEALVADLAGEVAEGFVAATKGLCFGRLDRLSSWFGGRLSLGGLHWAKGAGE